MRLKKKIQRLFYTTAFAGMALLGANGDYAQSPRNILKNPISRVELDGRKFDLENAKITHYADYGSKEIVVFINNKHIDSGRTKKHIEEIRPVQEEIYLTLEELASENGLEFLGMEGYANEFARKNFDDFGKMKGLFEIILNADKKTKKKLMELVCFEKGYCGGDMAFELMNPEKVYTIGIDYAPERLDKIIALANKFALKQKDVQVIKKQWPAAKGNKNLEKKLISRVQDFIKIEKRFLKEVVEERSKAFVDNLWISYVAWKENNGKRADLLGLVGGSLHYQHTPGVAERLDELKISYIILVPNSLSMD